MILTSNTEATENKVEFLNYAYTVKGLQYHSNNLLLLFELKENNNTLFKRFLCDILSLNSGCKAQCFDTTGHTPTQVLPSWLV